MNNKGRKKYIVFVVGLATIGLALLTFMPKIELFIDYCLEFQKNNFYGFVKIISLIIFIPLLVVTLCLNFMVVYKNFNTRTVFKDIQKISTTLRIEIKDINFSYKFLVFGLVFFITFLLLMLFNFIKLAFLFLFFSTLFIIKDFPSIKSLNKEFAVDNTAISNKYKQNYKIIYYFNKFIKIIFCMYVPYFFIWCLIGKSYLFIDQLIHGGDFQIMIEEWSQSGQNLYLLYCLFLNSLMLDYCMESFIIYFTYSDHISVVRLLINVVKRTLNIAVFAAGASTVVVGVIAYSPFVEFPGVNEFQIKYGRGYGYKTSLDYVNGTIYNRYLSEELMGTLIQKYDGDDKILDSIFFRLVSEDKDIVQIVRKNATVNELRYLGL